MYTHKSLKLAIFILLLVVTVVLAGCGGTAPPINHSPMIISLTADPQSPIEANQSTVITCLAVDQDNDQLTYIWTKNGGTITRSGSTITWTAPDTAGTYTITCTVFDGELIDIQVISIVVTEPEPENQAPVIISTAVTSVTAGEAYTYDVDATDPDVDTLNYSLNAGPPGMTIEVHTGVIIWTPTDIGSFEVMVEVSDGELSDIQSFIITVISSEAKSFLGEWIAIMPARISRVTIQAEDNQFLIRVWQAGQSYNDQPVYYYWGEQIVEISDFSDGTLELNWTTYSEWSCNQKIKLLANGALKIFSTENNYAGDYSFTYTDYFYNPEAINSYIPSLPGSGLYQDDPEFVNVVNALDSPKKICQYMENNINYKELSGPHSPYQTYLSKEGDCADYAVFASAIANFHGYECFFIIMYWTSDVCHAITVYNMGDYYTYSSNYLYFDQNFDSIEECVNHCASTYIGFIEGTLSSYEVYNWNYYNYRNINSR